MSKVCKDLLSIISSEASIYTLNVDFCLHCILVLIECAQWKGALLKRRTRDYPHVYLLFGWIWHSMQTGINDRWKRTQATIQNHYGILLNSRWTAEGKSRVLLIYYTVFEVFRYIIYNAVHKWYKEERIEICMSQ